MARDKENTSYHYLKETKVIEFDFRRELIKTGVVIKTALDCHGKPFFLIAANKLDEYLTFYSNKSLHGSLNITEDNKFTWLRSKPKKIPKENDCVIFQMNHPNWIDSRPMRHEPITVWTYQREFEKVQNQALEMLLAWPET